ncbi:hypothetical protein OQJ18_14065 [Fluoribacter dumoffii]|uniref:Uncharacterized protein n=1 Tax=Fluoribacter dumoffii TaxID=463 RepID=A0A377GE53_9GAMM|nr:hypothetical protein [Fluoribacter dumoffii]KTC91154.1 hypothetical protein Ldum_2222 [Fluoribacter dumoffii NY 23]MCW8387678.1 hypothetical protein [Fluoribacter dumoffii]MCW8416776.1 hypothetical protein [Fluoribacter dumoffii]MCW8455384.1 hypothetical protein [Fluoribacter dumoffii]MCW8460538.1 hypothetical protein [Fluoribacter dumoffii]
MPNFSTFSIYEKEMRAFINNVVEQTYLDKDKITTWLYSEGIFHFRSGQSADYYPYVEENLNKFEHRPLISKQHSIGQVLTGFMAVKNAFLNRFAKEDAELRVTLDQLFTYHLYSAPEKHLAFIAIQSQISSELNAYIDKNGPLEPTEALKLSIDLFEKKRLDNPSLGEDFTNQLILMREFLEDLSKKSLPTEQKFFKSATGTGEEQKSQTLTLTK